VQQSANVDVRPLELGSLNEAFALSSTAGWNQRLEDWRMLLELAPRDSVAAFVEERIVGTAIGIDYGAFGWIAMMLVDPVFRGRGVGARLLEAAMDALRPDLPIRLDATPLGRPLYQRYGFEDEMMLTRHEAGPSKLRVVTPASLAERAEGVRPLTGPDLPGVVARDTEIFGAKRAAVIEWVFAQAPQYACAMARTGSAPVDYCLGRPGRLFDQIGPVVAVDHDVARVLIGAALRAAGDRPVVIDAFDSRRTLVGWLGECGFEAQRPLYRMCRPGREAFPHNDHRASGVAGFAILGPEFS
jgi:GNAT superfamily N-acetyltransferase